MLRKRLRLPWKYCPGPLQHQSPPSQVIPTPRKAYLVYRVRTRRQPQEQEAGLKGKNSESVLAAESSAIIQRHEVGHDTRNDAKPRLVDTKPNEPPESTDTEPGSPETIEWYYPKDLSNGSACCFDEFPVSEITCCSNDSPHLFCYECAKRNAGEEIGKTK
jgi:hypothetical protein